MLFPQCSINWKIVFNGLYGLFTLFGFCPTVTENKGRKGADVILKAWSILHLAVATSLAFFAFHTFISDDSDIANFNNILKFSIMIMTHIVTCLESLVVRKNFIEIWIRVKTTDDLIGRMLPNYDAILNDFYKETSKKQILALLSTFVIELVIILSIYEMPSWSFMWSISIVPILMSRFRHLHHALFIEMLSCRFRIIKKELKSIVKFTKLESNGLLNKNFRFYENLYRKLSTIKSVYNTLWETSLLINRSFGLSQLVNLLQNFIQLTCDLYLLYSFLYKNNMTFITGEFNLFLVRKYFTNIFIF